MLNSLITQLEDLLSSEKETGHPFESKLFKKNGRGSASLLDTIIDRLNRYNRESIDYKAKLLDDIDVLTEVLEKISLGKFDATVPAMKLKDMGTLQIGIQDMASKLKTYHTALDLKIAEISRAEQEARGLEQKYRQIFENAAEGLFQVSPAGFFISANPAMAKILGHNSTDALISSVTDFAGQVLAVAQDRKQFLSFLASDERILSFETQLARKDMSSFWAVLSARTVRGPDGNVLYYEGSLLDISERKEKEDAQNARNTAEEASKAKSQFLANMSHEIRTPMNAIIGMADLALQKEVTADVKKYLEIIKSSSDSLLGIINDILDFSKIESGKMHIENIVFGLQDIQAVLVEMFQKTAAEKGVRLTIDAMDDVPNLLVGDPLRVRQILINLTSNAIKFTENGNVSIDISCLEQSPDNIVLKFSVHDTGIGIPQDRLDSIFDAFVQADGSTSRQYGGTGLGLAICHKLTGLLGGDFRAESAAGEGSTFSFIVPFGTPSATSSRPDMSDFRDDGIALPEQIRSAGELLKGRRILLVEDNEFNQMLAREVLHNAGISVVTADNGIEALDKIDSEFDAVLMDIQMPGMDGFEATQLIREDRKLTNIPIIAMTAHALLGDREKCLATGMDDYLTKPFRPEQVLAVLTQHIGRPRIPHKAVRPRIHKEEKEETTIINVSTIRAHIQSTYNLSSEKIDAILESAKTTLAEELSGCEEALAHNNLESLSKAAHKIKGVLGNLGLDKPASLAGRIENRQVRNADNAIYALKEQVEMLRRTISPFCQQ